MIAAALTPDASAPRGMRAPWRGRRRVLLHGGVVHSAAHPFSTALLIDGDTIAWIGEDTAAQVHRESADAVIDLDGAFVSPGFVDAHVHATSTGLLLTGLDLTGARSGHDVLISLRETRRREGAGLILGHGWDETRWSDARVPSREEIDEAAEGAPVYLSRIDVHSALVSSALIAVSGDAPSQEGWSPQGPLARASHMRVRDTALNSLSSAQRRSAQSRMRAHASSLGIVALHEMAGPAISTADDLDAFLSLSEEQEGPLAVGYWGELAQEGGIEAALQLGAIGVAGDLFIDGAIGSHTACLHEPYRDEPTTGAAYLSAEEVAEHVAEATQRGLQAGFHVIGDAASATVSRGFRQAADRLGVPAIRRGAHRIEHAEMLSDDDIALLADLGIVASMQPVFDALWGGMGGMYDQRLGPERMSSMNRFADISAAGAVLAFSSDAPVTPLGPWQAVHAATVHSNLRQRLSARAAFTAHTRGGWRSAGLPGVGALAPGAPAHLAIWQAAELDVHAPDGRVAGWSTDPRSGTPGLPVLDGHHWPHCLMTIVAGQVTHTDGSLPWP